MRIAGYLQALGAAYAADMFTKDLYAASYAGPVYRLSFREIKHETYELSEQASTLACGINPGWLELDQKRGILFCANEAYTIPNEGSLSVFHKHDLSIIANISTLPGPAQSTFYATNRLGIAHYAGSGVSTIDTSSVTHPKQLQTFVYTMDQPGPNATLQDKPYPHGIVADPTGRYVVVLDRGADLLRTYEIGQSGMLIDLGSYEVEKGNGPRHGVFVQSPTSGKTWFYVLGELTNSLFGFEVLYPQGDDKKLGFRQIYNASTYGTAFGDGYGVSLPSEIASAEGGRHLVVSVRNDGRQTYAGEESDTIASYEVDFETGALTLVGLTASGGKWPRTIAITRDGRFIVSANQYTVPGRVVVFKRDPGTGQIFDKEPLAEWAAVVTLPDGQSISHVLWDE